MGSDAKHGNDKTKNHREFKMNLKTTFFAVSYLLAFSQWCYAESNLNSLIKSQALPAVVAGESPPLRDIPQTFTEQNQTASHIVPLQRRKLSPQVRLPKALSVTDPLIALQKSTQLIISSPLSSFDGLSGLDDKAVFGQVYTPTDVNGDVGMNHYVQMVNSLYQVFDKKTGLALTPPSKLSKVFAAAGNTGVCATNDEGDPIVLYDAIAHRWLLSQFNFKFSSAPYHECIAISKTEDPTGGYYVYDFLIPNNNMGDYPKFGVWQDGYYMTAEQYSDLTGFVGEAVLVFDRAKMLAGLPAATNYHDLSALTNLSVLLPADLDGTPPPVGTPNYVIGFNHPNSASLDLTRKMRIFEVKADFSTANATGSILEKPSLTVAAFNPMNCSNPAGYCIPQPNTLKKLDALADRPMNRLQYRYFKNHCPLTGTLAGCGSLVFNHTVRGANAGESAVRWYMLKQNLATKAIGMAQQGTFAPDNNSRWVGSAALNKRGDLAIGYSISSKTVYPSIHYAGRLVTDPKNILSITGVLQNGNGAQLNAPPQRWGDYTMMSVDPVDDCTFWYTNQYYNDNIEGQALHWHTRIGSFKLSDLCL